MIKNAKIQISHQIENGGAWNVVGCGKLLGVEGRGLWKVESHQRPPKKNKKIQSFVQGVARSLSSGALWPLTLVPALSSSQ